MLGLKRPRRTERGVHRPATPAFSMRCSGPRDAGRVPGAIRPRRGVCAPSAHDLQFSPRNGICSQMPRRGRDSCRASSSCAFKMLLISDDRWISSWFRVTAWPNAQSLPAWSISPCRRSWFSDPISPRTWSRRMDRSSASFVASRVCERRGSAKSCVGYSRKLKISNNSLVYESGSKCSVSSQGRSHYCTCITGNNDVIESVRRTQIQNLAEGAWKAS